MPSELGLMHQTTSLQLINNNLSGSVPTELGQLVNLIVLSIQNNTITGSVPSSMCHQAGLVDVERIIKVDCDLVDCKCNSCVCD